ncbi:MAG: hypothetical protein Q4C48_06345 [Lachnospiraceae bacterium]|nr:hypothetical protein [Lachnospiraceae bacterium]
MQRKFILLMIVVCLAFCLCYPTQFTQSASYGLRLWYQALLPVLLPFLILTALLRGMGYTQKLDALLSPITTRFFRLPPAYGSVLFFGLLSGLPVSAVLLQALPEKEKQQGLLYPLLLSTHMSPGFLTGYLAAYVLGKPSASPLLFLTIYGGNLLAAWLFLRPKQAPETPTAPETRKPSSARRFPMPAPDSDKTAAVSAPDAHAAAASAPRSLSALFQSATQTALNGIFTVGVSVMLFSVLAGFCSLVLPPAFRLLGIPSKSAPLLTALISGLCEVTGGCSLLVTQDVAFVPRAVLVVFFASFGGLSGIFQTKSVLKSPFPLWKYIGIKISTALLSAGAMLIFLSQTL